jgi:DNA-3-methyladenine glycosylase II
MVPTFNANNFYVICDELAAKDNYLATVIREYGYPPLWTRPNSFSTLVLTILEQQVSLASAFAAYKKLLEMLTVITPEAVLALSDEELRSCYFSRQKIGYVRGLAQAIVTNQINLEELYHQPDDIVRATLKQLKGIGDWTVDIYLMHALQRLDLFPLGDLALINAIKMLMSLEKPTKEELLAIAEPWKPYRTIATMILWHYYIKKKNIKLLH